MCTLLNDLDDARRHDRPRDDVRRRRPGHGDDRRTAALSQRPDIARSREWRVEVAAEWELSSGEPFPLARHSYVAPAGDDAVLKVTPPEDDEIRRGGGRARALGRQRRRAAPPPRSDRRRRCCSSARARARHRRAGRRGGDRDRGRTGLKLWRPAAEPFRWIGDHVPRWLDKAAGTSSRRSRASSTPRSMSAATTLVHGDFHHHNILHVGARPGRDRPEADARRAGVRRAAPSSGTRSRTGCGST